jgi:hypothetical protein
VRLEDGERVSQVREDEVRGGRDLVPGVAEDAVAGGAEGEVAPAVALDCGGRGVGPVAI